jgi:metallophosphoesterase superfamily enzyme
MNRRIFVFPDTQLRFEDRKALKRVIEFVGEYQPDEVVHIGDLADFPQPSRWSKDTAAEFQGSVFEDAEYIKRKFFDPLRAVYSGPVGVIEGNHDERPRVYLAKYAPALAESRAFHMDTMLGFDEFGIEWLPDFYEIAPGWVATHGHKGGIRLTQDAGKTALNAAIRFGKSVVMGHTHRLAAVPKSYGYDGNMSTLWGVEVGNLMDMRQAGYLKGATANWQQGFAILHVNGNHVTPITVPIVEGAFTVDGLTYTI